MDFDIIYNKGFWDSDRLVNKAVGAWDFTVPSAAPIDTVTKEDYITICGLNQPIRFGTCRRINLVDYLPSYLQYSDIKNFTKVFEDFLNDMYPGYCGLSAYDVEVDNIISATESRTYDYEFFTEGNIGDNPESFWSSELQLLKIANMAGVNTLQRDRSIPGAPANARILPINVGLSGDFTLEFGAKLTSGVYKTTLGATSNHPVILWSTNNYMTYSYFGYYGDGTQMSIFATSAGNDGMKIPHNPVPSEEMKFRLYRNDNIIRAKYDIGVGWQDFPDIVLQSTEPIYSKFSRLGAGTSAQPTSAVQWGITYINISADGGASHTYNEIVSATEKVTNIQYLDQQIYSVDESGNLSSATPKYSILEKINRLTELHDPTYMDEEYLQFFANYLGYNVNINYAELGTLSEFNNDTGCSDVDKNKYLRFVIENLPNWYKIKTTKNAVRIMLYSFGIIGDIIDLYTKGKYVDFKDENDPLLTSEYYPSPHFAIVVDLDASVTSYSFDYEKRDKIIRAIESIKPINTVFEKISGRMTRSIDLYASAIVKSNIYQRVNWVD
jgi:hypothetical protein